MMRSCIHKILSKNNNNNKVQISLLENIPLSVNKFNFFRHLLCQEVLYFVLPF